MSKPPQAPPNSDIDGVHRDGTGPSRPLPASGDGGRDLAKAARETVARPDYSETESSDDRTG